MTITAPETPHASSTTALKEATLQLNAAHEALRAIDLRSLKGDLREDVREARTAVATALSTTRQR